MHVWIELLLKRYFRWTLLATVLVVVGAGYSLFLAKKISVIQTTALAEQKQAEQDLQLQTSLRDALQVSIKKYKAIFTEENLGKLSNVLPETAEFPSVLLTVQNVAAKAGYELDSLTISPVASAAEGAAANTVVQTPGIISQVNTIPNLRAYDLSVSISGPGGYNEFKKLVLTFESSQQLFDILNLNYTAPQANANGSSSAPSYSMTIRTYSYSQPTTP